ncbi:MAG TPA: extracellular solute-binding protein [Nocardioidaceae bacterium]|nr:extracellular solute-binding protein [Nocardioidaceae bacterium]
MRFNLGKLPATALVGVATLGLAACGGGDSTAPASAPDLSAPADKSGTLSMVTKFADPQYAPYFESVVAEYEEENPKVDIKLEQVGDQPYKDKIRVLATANDLPDIYFSWAGDFANKFIRAGLAADLTSVLGPDTELGKQLAPAATKAFEYEGKNYGLPINLDGKYLAYSGAAFEKAGISQPPATLEELFEDCDKLKAAGYTPIAFGNQFGWPALHYVTQLNAYNVPADTLDKDYNPATGEFTDPGYVKALEQLKALLDRCANPDANGLAHEAAQANFIGGKAAMQYIESLEFQVLTADGGAPPTIAEDWSFFRLPPASDAAGDTQALTGAPDGFLVNAKTEQGGLAADFLAFLASKQNAQQMVQDLGWLSPVEGSTKVEGVYPQLTQTLQDMSKASEFAIWLDTVTHADVASAYLAGVEGLVGGDNTPEDVMASVQEAAAKAQEQTN